MIAETIARRVGEETGAVVAPTVCYGMSHLHLEFAGTISLSPMTLSAVLQDIFHSLYRHGFRRVLVVNGHGGNQPSLQSAGAVLLEKFPDLRIKAIQWWLDPAIVRLVDVELGVQLGTHASNHETAFMQAIAPHAVHIERIAKRDTPVIHTQEMDSPTRFREKFPDGVMGMDPSRANAELGKRILEQAVVLGVSELESF
jgi:creatinine amidohydrolase